MKIGIMTIFNVPNYGAMIQCYALSKYLKDLGHEVFLYEVPFNKTNKLLHNLKRKLFLSQMTQFISDFLPPYTCNLSTPADLYMVGSDQVWNPEILQEETEKYMLSFIPKGNKKVSYAASFGTEKWKDEKLYEKVKELLSDFKYITVRESSGVDILKKQFGLDSHQVLDPCFLLNDYSEIIKSQRQKGEDEDRLVTYKLIYSYDWYLQAKKLAKTINCNLIELSGRYLKKQDDMHGLNIKSTTVSEWISSIATAKYVVTDSFHGCVFSLLHQRQFVVLPALKERSIRLTSLLSALGLTDRIAHTVLECQSILEKEINYEHVSAILEELREDSRKQLFRMLQV